MFHVVVSPSSIITTLIVITITPMRRLVTMMMLTTTVVGEMIQRGLMIIVGCTCNDSISCDNSTLDLVALQRLAEMKAAGVELNTFTYYAAISACEMGGQWEDTYVVHVCTYIYNLYRNN